MTARYCGLCKRRHYVQAVPEFDAPRRETPRDVLIASLSWAVVLGAYFMAMAWVWSVR